MKIILTKTTRLKSKVGINFQVYVIKKKYLTNTRNKQAINL